MFFFRCKEIAIDYGITEGKKLAVHPLAKPAISKGQATDYSRTVEVFKGSPWEAELVKGLLENNGIATIIKDGLMSTIAPYIAPDVTILVSEERYEDAMEIIRERDKGKDEE